MKKSRVLLLMSVLAIAIAAFALIGCNNDDVAEDAVDEMPTYEEAVELLPITLATVPSDDFLPFWVAENEGIFIELGLDVEIITFASSREMLAAVTADEAQGASLGMLSVSQLTLSGIDTVAVSRLAPSRGAVVASPNSDITSVEELAGVPVAAAEASLEEYILYRSMTDAGVPEDQIVLEQVADLRARPQLLMADQITASTMPWTLASVMGEQGAHILVNEQDIEDFTSTVLGIRADWLEQEGAEPTVAALLEAWNRGAELINEDPDSYLDLLTEKANLPEDSIEAGYTMQVYSMAELPDRQQVEDILDWAYRQGHAEEVISYEDFIWTP
ncbi:MAG: ABC transporter substrate-binding protein [Coriobacteriia bacterium]|nr:ABC transporter substrate-binding protein [Coriobacteriia bacterium]MCL2871039.1 ABC transporter substrate-binding protein [Coriobacteriia bacterium]